MGNQAGESVLANVGRHHAQRYLEWYYETAVWKRVLYRGVRTLKFVSDLWNYQEIVCEHEIDWIIETGTRYGGTAVFFGDLLTARGACGEVVTVDIHSRFLHPLARGHPKVRCLLGDSASPEILERVRGLLSGSRGSILVILDSDHRSDHVLRELKAYVPLMRRGDYLVVEDTIINGRPVRPEFGPGPAEALEKFLEAHADLLRHDVSRESKFGCSFAAGGYFVRE